MGRAHGPSLRRYYLTFNEIVTVLAKVASADIKNATEKATVKTYF